MNTIMQKKLVAPPRAYAGEAGRTSQIRSPRSYTRTPTGTLTKRVWVRGGGPTRARGHGQT